jgi:hypothetical protein
MCCHSEARSLSAKYGDGRHKAALNARARRFDLKAARLEREAQ